MFYDPRISLGMMFTLIGTILTAFGLSTRTNADAYAKSLGINANLWWGLVLLVFGIVALPSAAAARRAGNRDRHSKAARKSKDVVQEESCPLILRDRFPFPCLTRPLILASRFFASITPQSR